MNQVHVRGYMRAEVIDHIHVIRSLGLVSNPWEVTGQMVSHMKYYTNYYGCGNSLHRYRKNGKQKHKNLKLFRNLTLVSTIKTARFYT